MNSFSLSDKTVLEPELRLARFQRMGYDVEVQNNWGGKGDVKIILEAKKEGFHQEVVFASMRDADRWNSGDDNVKAVSNTVSRTSLALVVVPIVPVEKPEVSSEAKSEDDSIVRQPRRRIEV